MRGKPSVEDPDREGYRSIPAGAGEARRSSRPLSRTTVNPRGCGGSLCQDHFGKKARGQSPRVRGKLNNPVDFLLGKRSIPAGAGEADKDRHRVPRSGVNPRGCGGSPDTNSVNGKMSGQSPRVRGKPRLSVGFELDMRSIPAGAGEALAKVRERARPKVNPRGCGGSAVEGLRKGDCRGQSPRVRGKRRASSGPAGPSRSIPAGAGEALAKGMKHKTMRVNPRGCGGSGLTPEARAVMEGQSPRVRGKHSGSPWTTSTRGSIPAGAGEASYRRLRDPRPGVNPRGCGGSGKGLRRGGRGVGQSPRVRGKHPHFLVQIRPPGSIPAGAGEASLTSGKA